MVRLNVFLPLCLAVTQLHALDITGVVVDSTSQMTLDSAKLCLDLDPNECVYSDSIGRFHFQYPAEDNPVIGSPMAVRQGMRVTWSAAHLFFEGFDGVSGSIELTDVGGRRIFHAPLSGAAGRFAFSPDVPLPHGIHVLTVRSGETLYRRLLPLSDETGHWIIRESRTLPVLSTAKRRAEILELRVTRPGYLSRIYTPKKETETLVKIELIRDNSGIMQVLTAAQRLVPLADDRDVVVDTSSDEKGDIRYTYEKHDVVDNIQSITYLGLNDDLIWPGNIIKGEKAHDFVYEPVAIKRNPVTLSLSLETSETGNKISTTVDDPKLSTVRQGISDVLKQAIIENTTVPAKSEFSYSRVYNESQMSMVVGADVSYGGGSLNTQFDWNTQTKTTRIVAKYKQVYYSVDIDVPVHPADFFDPSVTPEKLGDALPAGSRPLYVAGVSYGMMAFMFIESNFEYESMALALDAAYSGSFDMEIDFDMTAEEMLQSSSIKIVVYGGSTAGLRELETGYQGFLNVIKASTNFGYDSPGVPLIYKFRHVIDNTLALVTLTSQYTLVKPLRIRQKVKITAWRFVCTMADDEGSYNDPDMDRFSVWVNAFSRAKTDDPPVRINPVNQSVYSWSTSGEQTMGVGAIHEANQSVTITFDTETYDFTLAELAISAYARDYDPTSSNEDATGTIKIAGSDFLSNGGLHHIYLYSADFTFRVDVRVELVD